jgi:hypothetical protein
MVRIRHEASSMEKRQHLLSLITRQEECHMTNRIETVEELQRRLSGVQVAMLATQDEHGTISSCPVALQAIDQRGDLWFLVDRHGGWVAPTNCEME